MRKRVVITGMGAVTPIGVGLVQFWEGLLEGRCGIGPITQFDPGDYPCRIAAEVLDFDRSRFFERHATRVLSRGAQFGVASTLLCLEDAAWRERPGTGSVGIYVGISNSAQDAIESQIDVLKRHGYRRVLPYVLTKSFPHSVASEAGRLTGFQSTVMTLSTGCTAGINALGWAADEIRRGRGEALLCCATDSTISQYVFAGFCRAGILSTNNADPARASRPFDAKRDGGVLGEGAGCLLLEERTHAQRRGARIYAEVLGFGTSGIGYNGDGAKAIPLGMRSCMQEAMASANCGPESIGYIGCHGVSDVNLDVYETQAIKAAFGDRASRVPISSVKSMIGIPQSAAGTLKLIASVMALTEGVIPPTVNYEYADPLCDLDYVPNHPRRNHVERALVLAHGFNGSDAAVIVGRHSSP